MKTSLNLASPWGERLMLVFGGVNAIEMDRPRHVRVTPVSDRTADIISGPFRANSGSRDQ